MNRVNQFFAALLSSSLLWGGLTTVGFYAVVHSGALNPEFFNRYFAGHWVEYAETAMFFVGVSGLLIKFFDLSDQRARLAVSPLGEAVAEPVPVAAAAELLARVNALPAKEHKSYLPRRVREALEAVVRTGSADRLDEELKFLSDVDAGRAHASYGMLRILIWAIPILGFLGTVIGITMAIASLNPQALEESLNVVTGGLGVAFDTTALALSLSMVLMFGQFAVDRFESKLLDRVDQRAIEELSGRFQKSLSATDPALAPIEQLAETLVDASARLVERQAVVWRESLEATNRRWSELTTKGGEALEQALSSALVQSLERHAETLAKSESEFAESNRRHWGRLRKALAHTAEATQAQHAELARQGDALAQLLQGAADVNRLEESLNQNLAALAGSQQLQDTLLHLSSTIDLLHARLGQLPVAGKPGLKVHEARQAA